jgi:glycosyltransferase involved in cell wall biosynthesis
MALQAKGRTGTISVIIPAYNEEGYIGRTLDSVCRAAEFCRERAGSAVEILVVDNGSTDATADIATRMGAAVLEDHVRGIARARNAGAHSASGAILVFVDADTLVPQTYLWRVFQAMRDPRCAGGSVRVEIRPNRLIVRLYGALWKPYHAAVGSRLIGRRRAMGMAQFCRREIFDALGGYDESRFLGEDGHFFGRLGEEADRRRGYLAYFGDISVLASARRLDGLPLWRVIPLMTPIMGHFLQKSAIARRVYYGDPQPR